MFDLGYVADFSTSIPGDPFEPPSPIDPEYQVEGIELEASENIETVLSHLGKGYDIAIAMWLIAKKRQTELLDNIKKFDPIIEVLLLFVRSAPPTEREEGRIIRMVSLSPEVIGMGLFYSQKTRDSMNNVAPGQCGICEAEHHILHSLQYILGKGDIPLTEEELVKYCKTLIKAGYSNALPAGVVKNLPDDAKRVIVDSLFEAKAYHQFIRLRRAINPDPEETLERLKNLPDPTWYMMFGSKMIEHLDPKNIKNVISHLIKHQFDASALDLLAETKPERLFEIFQAFLRAPYFPDGKYDLQIKARAESKATTAIRKIEMVPKERRTELAFEAFENGWAKGVFQYWDKFNLDRDNVELLEQFVALGEAKEFFEPNSGFNLTQIQIGNLARVAVENGHSASVLRNLDNIPTLAKEEITLLAIQKAKEHQNPAALSVIIEKYRDSFRTYFDSDTHAAETIAVQGDGFDLVLRNLKTFSCLDKEIFYALIQEHNASETLVRTGTVDQFDIDKEEAVDLYTHGLQLPEAYVCTLLESRGGPQIFSGIMNLSLKKRKIFNQLLANADPDNGYAISNEVILEFGRDQEIQQTMTDCDIDMNRFGNYDDSIEFEILDTTNFFALGLKAPLTQLSTDFETTYKMISKSLKKADPQTVERLGYYDKEKEKNISGTIVLERVRGAFATMKLWTSDAQKKIDTLHKKYQEAEKNAIGDGDGLADGAADLEAQDAIAAIQREGLECIRNFLKNLSNMSHRIGIQKKSMRSLQKEGFDFDFPQLDTNLQHIESAQSGINDVLVSSKHEYDENKGISETDAPLKTRKMKLHFAQKNLTNWFLIGEDTNCCVTFEHLLDYLLDIGVKLPVTEDMESGKRPYTSFFWAGESSVDDTAAGVMDNIEGHPLFASFHRGVIRNKYFEFITNFCSAVGIDRTVLGNGFNDVQTSDLSILCEDIAGGKVKPTFQKIGGDVFGTDPSNAYPLRHLFLEARDNPVYELPQVS